MIEEGRIHDFRLDNIVDNDSQASAFKDPSAIMNQ